MTDSRAGWRSEFQPSYALLVFAGFALASVLVHGAYSQVDVLLALIVVTLLVGCHFAAGVISNKEIGTAIVTLAGVLFIARVARPTGLPGYDAAYLLIIAAIILGLFATLPFAIHRPHPWIPLWGIVLVATMVAVALPKLTHAAEPGIDVFVIHRSGAEALTNGLNPYVHATAVNSSPLAQPGDSFNGYTYPPLTLISYALGDWLFGDPRFASLVSILVFIGLVVARAAYHPQAEVRRLLLGLLLVFAVHPAWLLVFEHAWTEPLALPLLWGVAILWRQRPTAAWVLLGLTLALKQYFILALPLIVFANDDDRRRRVTVSASVAILAVLPGLLPNPVAYIEATIVPTLTAPARLDAANLVHLGIEIPSFVGIGTAILIGIVLARRGLTGARFSSALSAVLGASFYLGFAAFANHWFMVASLALIATLAEASSASPSVREPAIAER